MLPAYEQPGTWRERVRAGLTELLGFLDRRGGPWHQSARDRRVPLGARAKALGATPPRARPNHRRDRRRAQGIEETATVHHPSPPRVSIGGVLSVLHARFVESRAIARCSSCLVHL